MYIRIFIVSSPPLLLLPLSSPFPLSLLSLLPHSTLAQVFRPRTPSEAIELVSKLLEYTPSLRVNPMEACAHPFFSELREKDKAMPNGRELPPLFNFTHQGMEWRHA